MEFLTIADCREACRIAPADTSQDSELTKAGNAAEAQAARYLNQRRASDLIEFYVTGTSPPELPGDMMDALRVLVMLTYERSPEDGPGLLRAAHGLLDPYRVDDIGV